jgi:glycosyltransferase involved in cell wall biosynthesis
MPNRHIVLISQIPLWSMARSVGGPAFHRTLHALASRHRVSLVTPELDYVDGVDMPDNVELVTFDHRFHGLWRQVPKIGWATDTLGWYTFQSSAWPAVKKLCEAGDVDLVYGYEIYGTPVARRAADAFGVPCVARYQGTLMSERRHMPLADVRFRKHLQALKTPADLVVMTNDGTRGDVVLHDLGIPDESVRFWVNGVDRDLTHTVTHDVRPDLGLEPNAPLLLTISRLSSWKRVDRALATLAELAGEGRDVHLAIVGVGPEEASLRERAVGLGVMGRAHFVGAVEREELASYYASADVMLSLYDYSNLANPVLEAMLAGTPVVALDTGTTSDVVKDGVSGVLVPLAEEARVAAITAGLLEDESRRKDLGDSAAAWARENLWTWEERMDAELDELERLMGSGAPERD